VSPETRHCGTVSKQLEERGNACSWVMHWQGLASLLARVWKPVKTAQLGKHMPVLPLLVGLTNFHVLNHLFMHVIALWTPRIASRSDGLFKCFMVPAHL
jgi:hypothetical protein